jgi:transposase
MDTSTAIATTDTLGRRVAPRRHRTVAEKIQIVNESRVAGTSVAEVARRHAVNANQVFAWRRQHDQGVLGRRTRRGARLIRVEVSEAAGTQTAPAHASALALSEGRIEITLTDGVRVAICGAVASETLEQVLAVLCR